MKNHFREMIQKDKYFGHDDFEVRTVNMCGLDVMKNGHLNCHVAYLLTNITLNVINGQVN